MLKIAVCAIFKDEAPYLLEWLAFHKLLEWTCSSCMTTTAAMAAADIIRRSDFARNVDGLPVE